MPITKIQPIFETSDGRKFTDEKDAQLHENLIMASESLRRALDVFNKALLKTVKTADGYAFEYGFWDEYFYVPEIFSFGMEPRVYSISLGYTWEIDNRDGDLRIYVQLPNESQKRAFDASTLYRKKANAQIELRKRLVEYAGHIQEKIDQLTPKQG